MKVGRPNILLIMADQLIPMLTGAYGQPVVKTPNLDRLAAEGVRFDTAYSPHPVCVPSRACLFSGLYSSRNGVFDNGAEFRAEIPTFFHHLRGAGYHCCASGKMHWIGPDQLHGLHERISQDVCKTGFGLTPNWRSPQKKQHVRDYVTAGPRRWTQHRYFDEQTHFAAHSWLQARGNRTDQEQPFILVISYHHPHEPFHPPPDLWDLYNDCEIEIPKVPDNLENYLHPMDRWNNEYHGVTAADLKDPAALYNLRRAYYACVTYIDNKVGELMAALKENGLDGNTIVLFTSDHGDMLGERCMVQKRSFYEYSSRIPLIAWAPGRWRAGSVIDAPVSLMDLFSTFVEMGTGKAPHGVDSRSLLSLLDGTEDGSDRQVISESHGQGVKHACFMIRKGDLKYIYVHSERSQLYNLREDPGEWNNLAGSTEFEEEENDLREAILTRFDPEAIERKVLESQQRRLFILEVSNFGNNPDWAYYPRTIGPTDVQALY